MMRLPYLLVPLAALLLAAPTRPAAAQSVGHTINVKGWHVRLDRNPDGSHTCAAMWPFQDKSAVGFAADTSANTYLIIAEPDAGLTKGKSYPVKYHADNGTVKSATGTATSDEMVVIPISDPDQEYALFGKSKQISVEFDGETYEEPLNVPHTAIQALGKCIAGAPAKH